jgi:putative DNA primase/helicase
MTPIEKVLSRLEGVKTARKGNYQARCPAHDDKNPSLSIREDSGKVLLKCHAGCSFPAIVAAAGLDQKDCFPANGRRSRQTNRRGSETTMTIQKLAELKGLPEQFLHEQGLRETREGVEIRYQHENGSAARSRLRTAPQAKDGSSWLGKERDSIIPYGLQWLRDAREAGEVFLVEGESDVWTLRLHGLQALGIPGAGLTRVLQKEHLAEIRSILVVKEPDRGGATFISGVAKRLAAFGLRGHAKVISLREDVGDINDLYRKDPKRFLEELERLRKSAVALEDTKDVFREGDRRNNGNSELWANPSTLGEAILASGERFAKDQGSRLLRYDGTTYRNDVDGYLQKRVKLLLQEANKLEDWRAKLSSDVATYLGIDAAALWDKPPLDRVHLLNGILVTHTRELLPHTPDYLSCVQLPIQYDPEATCPEWDRFIASSFDPESQEMAYLLPGLLMTPDNNSQTAYLLLGPGGTGKTTYQKSVEAFLGRENVAHLSMARLHSRFDLSGLVNKLANFCPDLGGEKMPRTEIFRSLTGGDSVTVEEKYRPSFAVRPFARLVIATNYLPRAEDAGTAFYQRFAIIPMNRVFRGTEDEIPAAELERRLSDPRELSGLLNRSLSALDQYRATGKLPLGKASQTAHEEFVQHTQPVRSWLKENLEPSAGDFVLKEELLEKYNRDAERAGRPVLNSVVFGRELAAAAWFSKEAQIAERDRKRGYRGWRLKE